MDLHSLVLLNQVRPVPRLDPHHALLLNIVVFVLLWRLRVDIFFAVENVILELLFERFLGVS